MQGSILGVIKGDARSLDNGSHEALQSVPTRLGGRWDLVMGV